MKKLNEIKRKIIPILKFWKVSKAGIFGSYARGEERKNSDVDILIEIKDNRNLSTIIRMKIALENAISKKIDLVEYSCLHPLIKKQALKDEVRII